MNLDLDARELQLLLDEGYNCRTWLWVHRHAIAEALLEWQRLRDEEDRRRRRARGDDLSPHTAGSPHAASQPPASAAVRGFPIDEGEHPVQVNISAPQPERSSGSPSSTFLKEAG